MKILQGIGVAFAAIVILTAIVIGGWQLGWWMQNSAANHQAVITQNGYGAQSAYVQETRTLMVEIATIQTQLVDPSTPASELSALKGQQAAEINQACALANNITMNVPSDIYQFASSNCS